MVLNIYLYVQLTVLVDNNIYSSSFVDFPTLSTINFFLLPPK